MDDAFGLLGPLSPLLSWPGVTDILVNGAGAVWVDGAGGMRRVPIDLGDESQVRRFATGLVAAGGRHVDFATPLADVRLGGGLRIHVALPPISPAGNPHFYSGAVAGRAVARPVQRRRRQLSRCWCPA